MSMEVTTLAAWCYLLRGVAEGGQQWRLMAATSRLSGVSGVRGATSPFSPGSLKHSQHNGHQYAVATHIFLPYNLHCTKLIIIPMISFIIISPVTLLVYWSRNTIGPITLLFP